MSENENPKAPSTPDDLSRREWILRLGEFVALAGISGVVPELATSLRAQKQPNVEPLPPGLYEPSQDHLVHALSSAGKNWTPPPGSETDYVLPSAGPYRPQFFSEEEYPTVTRMMEILLGKVEPAALSQAAQWFDLWLASTAGVREAALHLDPMHRALAVAFFGEAPVRELETNNPQAVARVGLRALHDLSNKLYGRNFLQLSESEQNELMTTISKAEPGTSIETFFKLARTEAIRGYYTSAEGLKELDYRGNAYYGEGPGCERKS
ncbi:MAG TPA: gluconate 2-dehydrogenase subunit 3 family protein [Candidatus Sulfotelmatobacter sp.]|nr:gluconate 2-dehydrogenase subunit 3 family protein [Candidatus Sulfotelmatobacter sp.]